MPSLPVTTLALATCEDYRVPLENDNQSGIAVTPKYTFVVPNDAQCRRGGEHENMGLGSKESWPLFQASA